MAAFSHILTFKHRGVGNILANVLEDDHSGNPEATSKAPVVAEILGVSLWSSCQLQGLQGRVSRNQSGQLTVENHILVHKSSDCSLSYSTCILFPLHSRYLQVVLRFEMSLSCIFHNFSHLRPGECSDLQVARLPEARHLASQQRIHGNLTASQAPFGDA